MAVDSNGLNNMAVHWSPMEVEFMVPNVFLKGWSGRVDEVVEAVPNIKLNFFFRFSSIESIGVP